MSETVAPPDAGTAPPKGLRWYDGFMFALPIAYEIGIRLPQ